MLSQLHFTHIVDHVIMYAYVCAYKVMNTHCFVNTYKCTSLLQIAT